MTDQDTEDQRREPRPLVHGRRTRVVVALIDVLLGLGVPVMVWGTPVLTVDGHAVGPLADPAGLGVTGTLPGDPMAGNAVSGGATGGVPEGAPAVSAGGVAPSGIATPPNLPDGPLGIPGAVLDAYLFTQRTVAATRVGCHLSWSVLAGIGRIESGHASDGHLDAFGNTLGSILGPRLDGSLGMAAIPDTDHGVLDADPVWDRAVGPMQFIPVSWRAYGVDGNGDGVANPNNIYDATITTGLYLCAGGTDLADPAQLHAAVFRYNHSAAYVNIVLQWAQAYLTDVVPTPSAPRPVPPGTTGNGGRPIVVSGAPQVAVQAVAPSAAVPQPTSSPAAPPQPTAPLPPVSSLPAAPSPSAPPSPPAATSPPPVPLPVTTMSSSPLSSPPATPTTFAELTSSLLVTASPAINPRPTPAPIPSLNQK